MYRFPTKHLFSARTFLAPYFNQFSTGADYLSILMLLFFGGAAEFSVQELLLEIQIRIHIILLSRSFRSIDNFPLWVRLTHCSIRLVTGIDLFTWRYVMQCVPSEAIFLSHIGSASRLIFLSNLECLIHARA